MNASLFEQISAMRLDRDGTMSILLKNGRAITASGGREVFEPTSAIASYTHHLHSQQLHLQTTRGHNVVVELPRPGDFAPVNKRPTIYLDQNHWSTLTKAIQYPERVRDGRELAAAMRLVEMATDRQVVLPMSSAHMAETCKQVDFEQRYRRALTILRLSAGWQLRDPLSLRLFELQQALTTRFRGRCLIPPAAVTLEPNAVHASREKAPPASSSDLPSEARWFARVVGCIGGIIDTMLDADHVLMDPQHGWAAGFQQFGDFLRNNPSGTELKRQRIRAKFMADIGPELARAALQAQIATEQMSVWYLQHSHEDVDRMPALGLFREVIHEKLATGSLRWNANDLTDMMYLTAGAGYCDHVVSERSHASHLANAYRRLGRVGQVHRTLDSLLSRF
ncbi:hypothetical protein AB0F15_36085 [Amycolatopsis sp. NPDC026612]|uniref:hypothetical protein n=1 Tax=Amycolatopsis sp. NPDC026612 TaxID=3155466 RepID=UPI0033D4061D